MGKIKYVLYPGVVTSKYDGQRHFISAATLMRLYRVRPEECLIYDANEPKEKYQDLIPLSPKYNGNYEIPHMENKYAN